MTSQWLISYIKCEAPRMFFINVKMGALCSCIKINKIQPLDESLVSASVLENEKKKETNHLQHELIFLASSLVPPITSLTPLSLLSGPSPFPSHSGSPTKSSSNLSSSSSLHLSAEVLPAEEVSAEEVPAEVVPAEVVPAEVMPAEVVPAEVVPAEVVPAEVVPAEEVPAEVVPAEVVPVVPAVEVPAVVVPAKEVISVSLERPCTGDDRDNTELLGFPNIGNTCFMNCALQCLLGLPAFCRDIQRQQDMWSSCPASELLRCFAELHETRLSEGSVKADILKRLKVGLSSVYREYRKDAELDPHLFILDLLCQMEEEGQRLKGSQVPYICPVKQFEFRLKIALTCTSCGAVVDAQHTCNFLPLNLSSHLTHSLENLLMPTLLECHCRKCSGTILTKSKHIMTLPRVLMIQLKRVLVIDGETKKLHDSISIPEELTLQGFLGDTVQPGARVTSLGKNDEGSSPVNSASNTSDEQEKPSDGEERQQTATVRHQTDSVYRLSCVLSHLGQHHYSGHGIADVRDSKGNGWLCLDDQRVRRTDVASVLKKRAHTAYVLFYECSGDSEGDQPPRKQN
ncbi:hypothetical protein DPEC_G00002550 [Dallia pectoralis]|uniref:Uncharacterized protein n=1 Tax=Dallia pectoralis TaxID=75939 RepID=A0ACC2HJH7_DALPE|nr:hypothetical protein DPEC_G00002550 [Dallia pectoralis]